MREEGLWVKVHIFYVGFGAIPEHSEIPSFQQGDLQQSVFERRYEIALQSWKMGGAQLKPQSEGGPPALSSNSSSIDLKEFVTRRGRCAWVEV